MSCRHDRGFKFLSCSAADQMPGKWVCIEMCGYWLTFNPERYYTGVAFQKTPGPTQTKESVPFEEDHH